MLIESSFHWKNGWYFTRQENGDVRVVIYGDAVEKADPAVILTEALIPAGEWCSIIAAVSRVGQVAEQYQQAKEFHNQPWVNAMRVMAETINTLSKDCQFYREQARDLEATKDNLNACLEREKAVNVERDRLVGLLMGIKRVIRTNNERYAMQTSSDYWDSGRQSAFRELWNVLEDAKATT